MYLALVLLATLHGLVFVPVALAAFGGDGGGPAAGGLGFGFGADGDGVVRAPRRELLQSLFSH